MNPNANDNIEQIKEDVRMEAEQPEAHAKKVVDSHVKEKQIEPHKLSYQDFKKIVPNAHKYSRKQLRKSHRDYLKYAKKKKESEPQFVSTHKLDFEVSEDSRYSFPQFRVGTVEGLWGSEEKYYFILSIINSEPGNGHVKDVFEWFEQSCRRDNKDLHVLELMNEEFKQELINEHGFVEYSENNLKKTFD